MHTFFYICCIYVREILSSLFVLFFFFFTPENTETHSRNTAMVSFFFFPLWKFVKIHLFWNVMNGLFLLVECNTHLMLSLRWAVLASLDKFLVSSFFNFSDQCSHLCSFPKAIRHCKKSEKIVWLYCSFTL